MKNIFKIATVAVLVVLVSGCGTVSNMVPKFGGGGRDYEAYARAQVEIQKAKTAAETARYQALAEVAKSGTDAAKTAAVMGLSQTTPQSTAIKPPQ
jgi:uncharacterized protein YceK